VDLIPASDLVVGDILQIEEGDMINVDGVLISSFELMVSECQYNPNSKQVHKEASFYSFSMQDSFILSGSKVMQGFG